MNKPLDINAITVVKLRPKLRPFYIQNTYTKAMLVIVTS